MVDPDVAASRLRQLLLYFRLSIVYQTLSRDPEGKAL